jgi:hypothetical protein
MKNLIIALRLKLAKALLPATHHIARMPTTGLMRKPRKKQLSADDVIKAAMDAAPLMQLPSGNSAKED